MKRLVSFAAAAASSLLLLSATAGHAQQPTGYYAATPVAAPAKDTLITSGTLWKCTDGVCVANKAPLRDVIMCQMVAQNVGKLTSFTVAGTALEADALAKCNSRAK
jgi:hypothetical protein